MNEVMSTKERIFEEGLYKNAIPKLKGEITKGKMKYRGIKLVIQKISLFEEDSWLEQRGKRITDIVKIEVVTNGYLITRKE
jgi:hypothetical protein